MLKNYLKIALRNILKYKGYSFINVFGLALGVAVFFIALQFTVYQKSWDKFHSKADDIYRVHQKFNDGGETAHSSFPIKGALVSDYSEIQLATSFGYINEIKLFLDKKQIVGENIVLAEPEFFDMFDVNILSSDKETIQRELRTNASFAIITKEYAEILFENEDPIGKDFDLGDGEDQVRYTVSAIVEGFPENSHFHFNIIAPIISQSFFQTVEDNWNNPVVHTYVFIPDKEKAKTFQELATLDAFIERHFPPIYGGPEAHLPVYRLTDIHLHSQAYSMIDETVPMILLIVVGSIGTLILILACINFMNLTTARATRRAKEVGMRKTMGATKRLLIYQFLGEAIIFSIISVALGMLLVELFLPRFNAYLQQTLDIQYFDNWSTIFMMVGITLALGVISGAYPAFVLSSYNPIFALKEAKGNAKTAGGFLVRKGLVVLQFVVVSLLLVTIIALQFQMKYMASIDVGYNTNNLVFVRSSDNMMEDPLNYQSFVNELRNNGAVTSAAGIGGWQYQSVDFEGMKPNQREGAIILTTSADYAKTMELKLLAGRLPLRENKADLRGIIFNEAATESFGWNPEEAIGKEIKLFEGDSTYNVLGVFKDFHFNDLMTEIEPMGMISSPTDLYGTTMMRLADKSEKTLSAIRLAWDRFDDGWPFEIFFSERQLEENLTAINNVQVMMKELTYLGIFIACMGLYGLTTFSTERRMKEIGIRKTLGASVTSIWRLIVSEFAVLVLIATLIGLLGGYFTSEFILQNFAYRISVGPKIILFSSFLSIAIAIITVSYQAIRSAFVDPVTTLRIE